jgi:hypothetical protein
VTSGTWSGGPLAPTVNLLSMPAVTYFWFECDTAAKERVQRRGIVFRERAFHPIPENRPPRTRYYPGTED